QRGTVALLKVHRIARLGEAGTAAVVVRVEVWIVTIVVVHVAVCTLRPGAGDTQERLRRRRPGVLDADPPGTAGAGEHGRPAAGVREQKAARFLTGRDGGRSHGGSGRAHKG